MKKGLIYLASAVLAITSLGLAPASNAANATVTYWGATASATTQYSNGYRAELATGAPDAETCGDVSGQAWTYGTPYTGSQLTIEFEEPIVGKELQVYFSNDLTDNIRLELSYSNLEGFWLFTDIADDYTCANDTSEEYPNNIVVSRELDNSSSVTGVRFTVMTEDDYPEIDAVAIVANAPTKPNLTKKVILGGKAKVGKFLVVNPFFDDWTGFPRPSLTFKWFVCSNAGKKSVSKKPAECKVIAGATDQSIRVKASMKGKYLRSSVTATNTSGSKTLISAASKRIS